MVLLSTIYFKGKWHHSIRPEDTRSEIFYYSESIEPMNPVPAPESSKGIQTKHTEMMTLRGNFGYSTIDYLDIKVLLIPYMVLKLLNILKILKKSGSNLVIFFCYCRILNKTWLLFFQMR